MTEFYDLSFWGIIFYFKYVILAYAEKELLVDAMRQIHYISPMSQGTYVITFLLSPIMLIIAKNSPTISDEKLGCISELRSYYDIILKSWNW